MRGGISRNNQGQASTGYTRLRGRIPHRELCVCLCCLTVRAEFSASATRSSVDIRTFGVAPGRSCQLRSPTFEVSTVAIRFCTRPHCLIFAEQPRLGDAIAKDLIEGVCSEFSLQSSDSSGATIRIRLLTDVACDKSFCGKNHHSRGLHIMCSRLDLCEGTASVQIW